MNPVLERVSWVLLCSLSGIAMAQQMPPEAPASAATPAVPAAGAAKAPSKSAQIDAGEPRADTSPVASAGDGSERAGSRPGTPAAQAAAPTEPAPAAAHASAAGRAPQAGSQKPPGATDRVALGTATVTGDREQPKVMYIVPWKKSDIGDSSGKPMNSLLDEALAPVDRDEFKREVAYYDAVNGGTPQNGASNPASKQAEK